MKRAVQLKEHLKGFKGKASLYQLEPPISVMRHSKKQKYRYVVVSSVNAMFTGPETYIFPANKNGEVTDWRELDGSLRGQRSHAAALENAGYKITRNSIED